MDWVDRPGVSFIKGQYNASIGLTSYGWVWHVYNHDYTQVVAESPTNEGIFIGEDTLSQAKERVETTLKGLD